jgi:hypothetical protein
MIFLLHLVTLLYEELLEIVFVKNDGSALLLFGPLSEDTKCCPKVKLKIFLSEVSGWLPNSPLTE